MFISLEGLDKAGKRTQMERLAQWLISRGHSVLKLSEPNDENPIGQQIRRILKKELPMPEMMEFQRLYVLDRATDILGRINPALEQGKIVIAERYAHSTLAYGMLSRPVEDFVQLHREVIGSWMRWPDVTYLIDISPSEAMRRLNVQGETPQLFEKKEKLERIQLNYHRLACKAMGLGTVVIIDGNRSEREVFESIKEDLRVVLAFPRNPA